MGGLVHHREQALVDLVALGEDLVQIHGADHGTGIGEAEIGDARFQIADLIGGLGGIHHLEEGDGIGRDRGIVAGDHHLAGDFQRFFHHRKLAADPVDERHDQAETGLEHGREAAEAFHEYHSGPAAPI